MTQEVLKPVAYIFPFSRIHTYLFTHTYNIYTQLYMAQCLVVPSSPPRWWWSLYVYVSYIYIHTHIYIYADVSSVCISVYIYMLIGREPTKFKALEVLVQQIAKGKQGLFLEDVASWVATRCPPILEWKKRNGNETCQGLWPNESVLSQHVMLQCVAWSAIDTERKRGVRKTFKSHMSGSQYMIVLM